MPPAHFGYLSTGVEDDATLRANRAGYERIQLRPRRLMDVSDISTKVTLFGTTWDSPIFLCPVGNQKCFHDDAEAAVARAARERRSLMALSTVATTPLEVVTRELGHAPWFQLYATSRWSVAEHLVRKAEEGGCPVMLWTVDTAAGRRTETLERAKLMDSRKCVVCHAPDPTAIFTRKPAFAGIDTKGLTMQSPTFTWEHLRRLRAMTKMKVLVKGIETREDALLCLENGADGIVVSNHGGRAEESGRGTIECLPEVVEAVRGRVPVLVDGGVRRGRDVFKALALGAAAVGVGRPYIWGLGAFGQSGVERVLELLNAELRLIMAQCGTRSIREIGASSVIAARY